MGKGIDKVKQKMTNNKPHTPKVVNNYCIKTLKAFDDLIDKASGGC